MCPHISTLLLLLVVFSHAEAFNSARMCIHACTYVTSGANERLCLHCAADPTINRDMCLFACGTMKLNALNIQYLGRICDKCFKEVHVMTSICWDCEDPAVVNSRICTECRKREFYF